MLPRTDDFMYACRIDAEPLDRYRKGGYHPILLGSSLSDGRYKILHKLRWGGYSTVWAARDRRSQSLGTYVAVKICVSERECDIGQRELNVLKELTSKHAGSRHVRLVDNFDLDGPNGKHQCLVFELLGTSLPDVMETRFSDGRHPGEIAKAITKQALLGLGFLHQHKIAHGAFALNAMDNVPEREFMETLERPEIKHVYRSDGKDLESGIPRYIVRAARTSSWPLSKMIKIVDFGESFLQQITPYTLRTPLPVRAPEVIFRDRLDYRMDLWSLGCMELTNKPLPERWLGLWEAMSGEVAAEDSRIRLQEWLEEMYFDGQRKADLTGQGIVRLGHIIQKLLRFEPSARASAREILNDPWFRD
ncbi:hypothetical protein BDW72DRAFT_205823 [Aspergillus terricola var. indicus]